MIVKCSYCGKQKIIDNEIYSSPIIQCDYCGKMFYERKIIEPALFPPPKNEKEKLGFFVYSAIPIGLLFFLFGAYLVFFGDSESFFIMITGLIVLIVVGLLILSNNNTKKKRAQHYNKILSESHKRLSDYKYQENLIISSNNDKEIIGLLHNYNSQHNFDFSFSSIIYPKSSQANSVDESAINENGDKEADNQVIINDRDNIILKDEVENCVNEEKYFCRKCGTELFSDSIFCHRCGEKVKK